MREYNGRPAKTLTLSAGTALWRIYRTGASYPPNGFNSTAIAPLIDARNIDITAEPKPAQGRFDPVRDPDICSTGSDLGGYLYVGLSMGAAVAEGLLRNIQIPASQILRRHILDGLSLARMTLDVTVEMAALDDQANLLALNLDNEFTAGSWRNYRDTRVIATKILVNTPSAAGLRYRCRNGFEEVAAMLIDGHGEPTVTVAQTGSLDSRGWAWEQTRAALWDRFRLTVDDG